MLPSEISDGSIFLFSIASLKQAHDFRFEVVTKFIAVKFSHDFGGTTRKDKYVIGQLLCLGNVMSNKNHRAALALCTVLPDWGLTGQIIAQGCKANIRPHQISAVL